MIGRDGTFVAFGVFIALSAAYAAGRIVFAFGLGVEWAAPISALVFALTFLAVVGKPI